MILFAPAHMGANVVVLALEAVSSIPFLRYFPFLARFESPLIDQLRPGSPELTALVRETSDASSQGMNAHVLAQKVVIAEYEKIVRNVTFCNDPPACTIPDTDHTSVCKPSLDFPVPLEFLEECL